MLRRGRLELWQAVVVVVTLVTFKYETDNIQSEVLDSTIAIVGDLAWAAYDLRYSEEGGSASDAFDSRWTGVLRRDPDTGTHTHTPPALLPLRVPEAASHGP